MPRPGTTPGDHAAPGDPVSGAEREARTDWPRQIAAAERVLDAARARGEVVLLLDWVVDQARDRYLQAMSWRTSE